MASLATNVDKTEAEVLLFSLEADAKRARSHLKLGTAHAQEAISTLDQLADQYRCTLGGTLEAGRKGDKVTGRYTGPFMFDKFLLY